MTLGSAGDVLPLCALGRALRARGHSVAVAANPVFASLVRRAGLDLLPLGSAEQYARLIAGTAVRHPVRGFLAMVQHAHALLGPAYALIAAHRPARVVAHPLVFAARVAEERLGLPALTAHFSPALLMSAHRPPVMPGLPNHPSLPRWYKRGVWWATDRLIFDVALRAPVNAFRATVGLGKLARVAEWLWRGPAIALFPEWFASRQPDWPRGLVMSDFPRYEDAAETPPELAQFLDDGPAPLVFTAGTGNRHAREYFAAAAFATASLGQRAILLTQFDDQIPSSLPAGVRHVGFAPLGPLCGRAALLAHHGGIGTAASALAAGVPQLVLPHAHDQPDNAARLERLGVSATVSSNHPRAAAMAQVLGRLLASDDVRRACRAAAALSAGGVGLLPAVRAVEDAVSPVAVAHG